jgi:divalent metal cation (Fe/Co/Zn/Cd) transporter
LTKAGYPGWTVALDILVTALIVSYYLVMYARLLVRNARSLLDLPLCEADQLIILSAMVQEYDGFVEAGTIYSQMSGNTRLIQIELYFDRNLTADDLERMRGRIEERLRNHFKRLVFHLIPRCHSDGPGV